MTPGTAPTPTAASYVPNPYFSFPYVATYFANAGYCSAAISQCSVNYLACTAQLGGGDGGGRNPVTVVVPGGGGTTVGGGGTAYGIASAASICKRDRLTHPAAVVACYPLLTQHHRYRQQPLQRGLQRPPAQHVLHVRHHRCRLLLWHGNGERCSEADSGGSVCWAGWRVCSAHLVTSFASPELECGWRKSKRVFCLAFGVLRATAWSSNAIWFSCIGGDLFGHASRSHDGCYDTKIQHEP